MQNQTTFLIFYTKYQLVTEPTIRGFLVKKNSKKFVTHQNRQDTRRARRERSEKQQLSPAI